MRSKSLFALGRPQCPPLFLALQLLLGTALSVLPGAAQSGPRPYLEKATVSFRALPGVQDPHPINPDVHYVGGYELTARGTAQFTGLSDLQLFPDGSNLKLEAISDQGAAVTFFLRPDETGALKDSELEIDRLRDSEGLSYDNKDLNDAEDIAYDPVSLRRYVSFERFGRIMTYAEPLGWRGKGGPVPFAGLPQFPRNEGMEGLTYIQDRDGDSLLIGVEAGGFWRCGLSELSCREVESPTPPGFLYKLTSLAVLDYASALHAHDVLALYRYYLPFDGLRSRLSLLHYENNRLTKLTELAQIDKPLPSDNYEGVAAVRFGAGYRIYLICDGLEETDKPKILIFDWTP